MNAPVPQIEPTNGRPPLPPTAPAPILAQSSEPSPELAEVLSPSQAKKFIECPAKWYFEYMVGLPDPMTGALALGRAVHRALGENFLQKIKLKADRAVEDICQVFREAWAEETAEAELRDDEDPGTLQNLGQLLTEKYMVEAAPKIQPVAVEQPVEGEIGGVQVRGFIDLVDTEGTIIDLKTKAKKPNVIGPDDRFQLSTYDLLYPESRGRARIDSLIKTKTIQLVQQSTEIGAKDVHYCETVYPMVQDAIRDGIFYPRRTSRLCSKRNCPFWRACEKEFGGEVDG